MPESLKKLIDIISYLPWIWEKTATKLGFFLLKSNSKFLNNFAENLRKIQEDIVECSVCHSYTDNKNGKCEVCNNMNRENKICVIEDYLDLVSIEKLKVFRWYYHVIGWSISPMNWVLPSDLNFLDLFKRIEGWNFDELIIATNPNIEWEATAMYIKENIPQKPITITRLSKWLPNAWYIEYADEITLINAFRWRN